MESQELLNIVTISISTILSVGAILLALWFYKESNKHNKETALMQIDIRNVIEKMEQLYNRTYTDTFGALKTQIDAMQKHIFSSSVGDTNTSEPNQLRFSVLGCITEKVNISIDDLYKQVSTYNKTEITETIYTFHREGLVNFDGQKIKYLKNNKMKDSLEGQGSE